MRFHAGGLMSLALIAAAFGSSAADFTGTWALDSSRNKSKERMTGQPRPIVLSIEQSGNILRVLEVIEGAAGKRLLWRDIQLPNPRGAGHAIRIQPTGLSL